MSAAGARTCGATAAMAATMIGAVRAGAEIVAGSRSGEGCALAILQWLQHGIVPCMKLIIDLVWQHTAAPAGATAANTTSAATSSVAKRLARVEIWFATIERTFGSGGKFRGEPLVHR